MEIENIEQLVQSLLKRIESLEDNIKKLQQEIIRIKGLP